MMTNTSSVAASAPGPAARVFVYAGALLFVASLVSGGLLYLRLGEVPQDPSGIGPAWRAIAIDTLLFGLFALHHSLFARTGLKAWLMRTVPPPLERSVYVWIASLLFFLVTLAWQPLAGRLYALDGPMAWLLTAIQIAGMVLTVWAAAQLDAFELAGLRQLWLASAPPPAASGERTCESDAITARGAYGVVRHPIYFAFVLMVWFTPVMTTGRLVFAAITTAYLVIAVPWEERSLVAAYGDVYRRYCARVRWKIVPGLY